MNFRNVHFARTNAVTFQDLSRFGPENAKKVRRFHRSFPEYSVTPLAELSCLAASLGVSGIYVKDESFRFGLNAFKVLGGSYAIGRCLGERLGIPAAGLNCGILTSDETRKILGDVTFVTATDGNHGRGVAWTANRLGQKSVVYMPKGSAEERLRNIRALGSDASVTELCYDDAVRLARENAEKYSWILVQDTAWDGYEKIPGWIMEGYTTMALEAVEQLRSVRPTHVFLQAGVGSMAAAVAAFFSVLYGGDRPIITIVEPNKADCFFRTAEANDGRLRFVTGEMDTIMAGLACGEPCTIAWDILRRCADNFVSIPDFAAASGMRILANPLGSDLRIISGESGASAFGLVCEVLRNESLTWLRSELGLGPDSRILCFSTEGATDRENYRRIVWDGIYNSD